jgi:hypothetical protein
MQATEALLEARKFDAFNRMSAFVVHDLKNIVTQLSLMMKNAEAAARQPGIPAGHAADRRKLAGPKMRQLMLQLREGATPPGTAVGVDLEAIARRIDGQGLARSAAAALELDIAEPVVTRGP